MVQTDRRREELFATIDAEAADGSERDASKILYDDLERLKCDLGAVSEIPVEDRRLSTDVRNEARRRSQEIRAGGQFRSRPLRLSAPPIPAWLVILWILASLLVVAAFWWWW